MNDHALSISAAPKSRGRRSAGRPTRGRPKAVQFLLPVWGHKYLTQFLEFGLPTLLASGNIPAVVKELPSKFVFLTSTADADLLRVHPGISCLASICDVEIQSIDDLITGDNSSTTITLAYARAVQDAGENMVDTCFFFLISDYLIADGSLRNVLQLILNGASGVLAGNFQVVAETAKLTFHNKFDCETAELTIAPRDLMSWSLKYLHPVTTANTINFPLTHSHHSNRLFWKVDENTLIGKFFLLHMICIRPEVTEFVVGSSCDYSFIPELCPSDNVSVMTDSDDYLVVEMQPRHHEQHFLRAGPPTIHQLAGSLAEWTTERHRKNAESTLVFHATDIPEEFDELAEEADSFLGELSGRLPNRPQPHREHPYWLGAIAAHERARMERQQKLNPTSAIPTTSLAGWRHTVDRICHRGRYWIFGLPPKVRPFHPRWPDYRAVLEAMRKPVEHQPTESIVVISSTHLIYNQWPAEVAKKTLSLDLYEMLAIERTDYLPLVGSFGGGVIILEGEELKYAPELMALVRALVVPGGFVVIVILNGRNLAIDDSFNSRFARDAHRLFDVDARVLSVSFVPTTRLRHTVSRILIYLSKRLSQSSLLGLPFVAIAALGMAVMSLLTGLGAVSRHNRAKSDGRLFSTACIGLKLSRHKQRLPKFEPELVPYWHGSRRQLNGKEQQARREVAAGRKTESETSRPRLTPEPRAAEPKPTA